MGEFTVNLEGSYSENYEKDGKKLADWGFPYSLQFIYSVPKEQRLHKIIVKDIQFTGEETGRQYKLPDIENSRVRVPEDYGLSGDEKIIRASAGLLAADNYKYEAYTLEATVVIYEDADSFKEESVTLKIETNYRKEKRSDWFDEKNRRLRKMRGRLGVRYRLAKSMGCAAEPGSIIPTGVNPVPAREVTHRVAIIGQAEVTPNVKHDVRKGSRP